MAHIKRRHELNYVAILVISILGVVAFASTVWSGVLIHEALTYEPSTEDGRIDAAVVALIGQMVSIATLTIGGLTAMLTSTGPKPPPPPSVTDPVPVVGVPGGEPVTTTPEPEPAPLAPGGADTDTGTDVGSPELEPAVDLEEPAEPQEAPVTRRRRSSS